jgi:hypothetical protein
VANPNTIIEFAVGKGVSGASNASIEFAVGKGVSGELRFFRMQI